jgi:DNA (cytosine-5)-methyltransferase 1
MDLHTHNLGDNAKFIALDEIVEKPSQFQKEQNSFSIVSMFSGCGGMDLGFKGGFQFLDQAYKRLPFSVIWANDLNSSACSTYRHNLGHPTHCGNVWELMDTLPAEADIIIGGFPCQDISINGKGKGIEGARSGLYRAMVEAIGNIRPKMFVAENVKGLLMKHNQNSLDRVLFDFRELGYNVTYKLYRASDFGVPQNRDRVFIVGTRNDIIDFNHPVPELIGKMNTTAEYAISNLIDCEEDASINHIWSRAKASPDQGSRRIVAHKPAQTMRAECHGNIQFHYSLPRRISMREAARFQSFPDNFIFQGKLRETERQIGNAVPPVLAWHIASACVRVLAKF